MLKSSSKSIDENTKRRPFKCKICEAPARYAHFGVISCESCKMFFRRNAHIERSTFECNFGSQCEINIYNRHICTKCRLDKCFRSGMSMKLFRLGYSKSINRSKNKNSQSTSTDLVKTIKKDKTQMLPTLNLLQSDISKLTNNQWTLLSNVIHSFDEDRMKSICQRLVEEDKYSQSIKPLDEILTKEFFRLLFETTDICLRLNGDICALPHNDRSIVLRTGADCLLCLGGAFIMYQSQLNTCQSFIDMNAKKYGTYGISLTLYSTKFLDPDVVLVKMGLLLLVFSKNTYIFSSTTSLDHVNANIILQIQNRYAEITWKYLLYKYGYHQAIQRFMNLILCLLAVVQTMSYLQSVQPHINDVETIAENSELELILDDINQFN
ncbi:unnamed protein product [Rotaria sordida]|uniref:Nuclear receptor n=1 Tax=Rotaria sordida TaxID=392033 RepID=A0A819U0X5_9BILA|nr:unnamed protein product [Rotaria sordida]